MHWTLPEDLSNDFISSADLQLYAHILVLICLKNNVKSNHVVVDLFEIDTRPSANALSAADVFTLMSFDSDLILESDGTKKQSSEGE